MIRKICFLMAIITVISSCSSTLITGSGEHTESKEYNGQLFDGTTFKDDSQTWIMSEKRGHGFPGLENIALHKPVTASSFYSHVYHPNNAVDGRRHTSWGSASSDTNLEWIYIDLLEKTDVSGIGIQWDDTYFAPGYEVYVSNNSKDWHLAYTCHAGNGGTDIIMGDGNYRYIGIAMANDEPGTIYGIKEFEVYKNGNIDVTNYQILTEDINKAFDFENIEIFKDYLIVEEEHNYSDYQIKIFYNGNRENPVEIATVKLPGTITGRCYAGNYGYIGTEKGLYVLDLNDIYHPRLIETEYTDTIGFLSNNDCYLFAVINNIEVKIFNIENPEKIALVNQINDSFIGSIINMTANDKFLAFNTRSSNYLKSHISLYDITDIVNPVEVYSIEKGNISHVRFLNNLLYFSNTKDYQDTEVYRLDISDLSDITIDTITIPLKIFTSNWLFDNNKIFVMSSIALSEKQNLLVMDISDFNDYLILSDQPINENAIDLCQIDNYLYIANASCGIDIFKKNDGTDMYPVNTVHSHGSTRDVQISGNLLATLESGSGISLFNISDPLKPVLKNRIIVDKRFSNYTSFIVVGEYLYALLTNSMDMYPPILLHIYDISDPANISFVKELSIAHGQTHISSITLYKDYLIVNDRSFLHIIDISQKDKPQKISKYDPGFGLGHLVDLKIDNNKLYLVGAKNNHSALGIYDISNINELKPLGFHYFRQYYGAYGIAIEDNYAYVTYYKSNLAVLDVSDSTNPVEVSLIDLDSEVNKVALQDNYLFVANDDAGVNILDISNPLSPNVVKTIDTAGSAYNISLNNNLVYISDMENGVVIIGEKN